jgi:hypothetical protein
MINSLDWLTLHTVFQRVSKYSTLEHVIKSTRLIGSIIPQLSLAYHAKECYMYFAFLLPSTSFL